MPYSTKNQITQSGIQTSSREYGTATSRITFCPALPLVIFNDLQADRQPKL